MQRSHKEVRKMAVLNSVRPVSAAPSKGSFVQMISSAFAAIADWNDARNTYKALSKLTDRQLDDIGLNWGDVEKMSNR